MPGRLGDDPHGDDARRGERVGVDGVRRGHLRERLLVLADRPRLELLLVVDQLAPTRKAHPLRHHHDQYAEEVGGQKLRVQEPRVQLRLPEQLRIGPQILRAWITATRIGKPAFLAAAVALRRSPLALDDGAA